MNYLTLCAIFKDEEPYIGDWIKYHLGIGIEHIYLYNNNSSDKSNEIAKDIGKAKVTVETIGGNPVQGIAYERCLYKAKNYQHRTASKWLGFIDIDEYLVPLKPDIQILLKKYEDYPAVCPHWVLFGSSGRVRYSAIPVAERFIHSQEGADRHVKSIVQPERTFNYITPHRFFHEGKPVDENLNLISETDSTPDGATRDNIYVAHYATKSYNECMKRRSKPRADTSKHRHELVSFFEAHDRNEVKNLDVYNKWKKL